MVVTLPPSLPKNEFCVRHWLLANYDNIILCFVAFITEMVNRCSLPAGVPRVRVHRRRSDAEELLVPRVHAIRPDHTQVQLVVLRGLQVVQEAVRQQHSHIEELSADEGVDVLLVVRGRAHRGRVGGRRDRGRIVVVHRGRRRRPPRRQRTRRHPSTVHRVQFPARQLTIVLRRG